MSVNTVLVGPGFSPKPWGNPSLPLPSFWWFAGILAFLGLRDIAPSFHQHVALLLGLCLRTTTFFKGQQSLCIRGLLYFRMTLP